MGVASVRRSKDTHSVTHSHTEAVWTSVHDAAAGGSWRRTLREAPLEDGNAAQKDGSENMNSAELFNVAVM